MSRLDLSGLVLHGTYRVTRQIGRGAMGAVYEAEHLRLPRRFAIKFLHAEALRDPEIFPRFQREAEIATSIGHPNIVQVIDFNVTPDHIPFMVMELLEGERLYDRMKRQGPFDLDALFRVLDPTLSALHAAHSRGVVHRDLKPQNIFLARGPDGEDAVKVLDFGISKLLEAESIVTTDGTLLGTPAYMAPEQAEGRTDEIDARADLFAIGAIAYEALTARRAFVGDRPAAILYKVCHIDPPSLKELRPDLPLEVRKLVERALAKSPAERFQTAMDLRAALRNACGVPSALTPPPASPDKGFEALPDSLRDSILSLEHEPRRTEEPKAVETTFGSTVGQVAEEGVATRRRGLWLASSAAALVTIVGLGFALSSRWNPSTPNAPVTRPINRPAPELAEAALVELRIVTEPTEAALWLDGLPVRSPLRAARSQLPRRLRAEASGFAPKETEIRFSESMDVHLLLEKLADAAPKTAPPTRSRALAKPLARPVSKPQQRPKGPWMDEL